MSMSSNLKQKIASLIFDPFLTISRCPEGPRKLKAISRKSKVILFYINDANQAKWQYLKCEENILHLVKVWQYFNACSLMPTQFWQQSSSRDEFDMQTKS